MASASGEEAEGAKTHKFTGTDPTKCAQWKIYAQSHLRKAVAKLDPSRTDIETFTALTVLDDTVYFARLKAGV